MPATTAALTPRPADAVADPDAIPSSFSPARPPSLHEQPLTPTEQALVAANTGLAYSIVRKRFPSSPFHDDLIQEALLGIMEAARRFDPERGCRFSTYATWRIRAKLSEHHRRRRVRLKVDGASSFDDPDGPLEPIDPNAVQPFEVAADQEAFELDADRLHNALAGLQPRERDILWRRARGETLKMIGDYLRISKERVRQLESRALGKARKAVGLVRAA